MLRQRVITALFLVCGFIAILLLVPFSLQSILFALVAAAGAWEWAALVGVRSALARLAYAAVVPALCLALWAFVELDGPQSASSAQPWLATSALLWSAMLLALKYYPLGRGLWGQAWIRALMGWAMLTAAWLAVSLCLTLDDGPFVLFLLVLTVATADIGAFFIGRRFGQHALAADISPAKTWEGFLGGILCVVVLTTLVWQNLPLSQMHLSWGSLLVLGLATAGASVVGDLTVSLIKREVGLKDSGSLLPGHGGLLDRLDSICGAAPVFALGLLLVGY